MTNDEYNTSKTCSSCSNPIELYRNRIRRKKKGVLKPIARMLLSKTKHY